MNSMKVQTNGFHSLEQVQNEYLSRKPVMPAAKKQRKACWEEFSDDDGK